MKSATLDPLCTQDIRGIQVCSPEEAVALDESACPNLPDYGMLYGLLSEGKGTAWET